MTKSRGIKRPAWPWTNAQVLLVAAEYLSKTQDQLAAEIGCTKAQLARKIHQLKIRKPVGCMLVGKIHTAETREKIRLAMKHAAEQGRLKRPSDVTMALMQAGSQRPEVIKKRAAKAAATMTGIPQRMDGLTAAAEHNINAKTYTVIAPTRDRYTFTNLRHFVRENPHLFDQKDIIWKRNNKFIWCRATNGLSSLFIEKEPAQQWKGWRAVSKQQSIYHATAPAPSPKASP